MAKYNSEVIFRLVVELSVYKRLCVVVVELMTKIVFAKCADYGNGEIRLKKIHLQSNITDPAFGIVQ
ncbi:hypothetical protein T4D_9227 [Trichinella pseudospiralis]|uniref:Uncharacterized protein n=1 Tax=Trichinella pseudospiralis TaxID=6337 RepID=A0A0V1FXV3_TRIPS|nr:hypothetical protein T4D_9227 [Trichinella pseudospiralis]